MLRYIKAPHIIVKTIISVALYHEAVQKSINFVVLTICAVVD